MSILKRLEEAPLGTRADLSEVLDVLPWNQQGLVAAIAQDATSKEVLMLGWMDRTAIERTLEERRVWYFSRSRNTYWRKGETSGHEQELVSMRFDCDGDALLLSVNQTGPACHTYRETCFYLSVDLSVDQSVDGGEIVVITEPTGSAG